VTRAGTFARLAVAALAIAAACPAHAEECRPDTLASFDMGFLAVFVPVTIDGQNYAFMVDTGGSLSTLAPAVASTLNLAPATIARGEETFMTDGTMLDRFVTVGALQIGAAKIAGVRFMLQPQQSRAGIAHFAGTVAPDFLRNFDLDFDFGRNTMSLLSREHCPDRAASWTDTAIAVPFQTDAAHHIVVPVKLDGVQTTAAIDTGSSTTVMSALLAERDFHLAPGKGLQQRPGATARSLVRYQHAFQTLKLNGVEIERITIGILPDEMATTAIAHHQFKLAERRPTGPVMNAVPLIIGLDQLRKFHLYVDYRNEMLYVAAANAAYETPPPEQPAAPAATQGGATQ
jgi:predicted aspartyl protease